MLRYFCSYAALGAMLMLAARLAVADQIPKAETQIPVDGVDVSNAELGEIVERVPFEWVLGRPVVSAMIDGKGPYRFIFDTGATICLLNGDLVAEIGLPVKGKTQIGDPAGPEAMDADEVVIPSLALGKAVASNLKGVSWGDHAIQSQLGGVRGIIGMTTFADLLVTIDSSKGELVLSRGVLSEGDGSVAYVLDDGGLPRVPLRVAGEVVETHVDTGNPGELSLPLRIKDKARLAGELMHARARTASGEFDIVVGQLDEAIRFAGAVIANPEVHFTERFDWGNVGSGLLSRFIVTIDQTNHRVRLTPADVAPAPRRVLHRRVDGAGKNKKRYGFMLAMMPSGPVTINGTLPGSIAEKAGLQAGDRIVRANGVAFDDLDMQQRGAALRESPLTLLVEREGQQVEVAMSLDVAAAADGSAAN